MSYGRKFSTYEMDVQVSHSVHTKIQKESNIWTVQSGPARNNKNTMQIQRSRNTRRAYDAGSCTSTIKYTTKT